MLKESTEYLILDTIKNSGSMMSLFKTGYSYASVMEWCHELEKVGKIVFNENGYRELTNEGRVRWAALKKRKGVQKTTILPYSQYKIPRMDVDEIYLP